MHTVIEHRITRRFIDANVLSHSYKLCAPQVDNQRTELLQTPVVSSYLYAIRKNLAFWVYLVYYLVFYGAFLVSLYLFTLTAYNPLAEICTNGKSLHTLLSSVYKLRPQNVAKFKCKC